MGDFVTTANKLMIGVSLSLIYYTVNISISSNASKVLMNLFLHQDKKRHFIEYTNINSRSASISVQIKMIGYGRQTSCSQFCTSIPF